ncbi:restriction endonuclease [Longilinea arvoryzae]|uniref:Restriction endonuclease n=1 Tax=Longilinea arvoryzae TaxID=360412 RepID=A0A0S7BIG5_9CHLR|nr:restriction endonuclease [Longilinea arvoryzae]GAP14120.1 restriction endonuclease [Longilinea arvoryzae]
MYNRTYFHPVLPAEPIDTMQDLLPLLQILFAFWPLALVFTLRGWQRGRKEQFPHALRRGLVTFLIFWGAWASIGLLLLFNGLSPLGLLPEPWNTTTFVIAGLLAGGGLLLQGWWQNRDAWRALRTARSVQELQELTPEEFEELIAVFFRSFNYRARRVGQTGDHGVDLVVYTKRQGKWIVQCKRYRSSVGEPVVRDFYGTMLHEAASQGFVMTTGTFTPQAVEWVRGKPITLYDGPALVKLLRASRRQRHLK